MTLGGEKFAGASNHPLLQEWVTWAKHETLIWQTEYADLAERAESLACNDPFVAALVAAHLIGTLGPTGLRSTSLYDVAAGQASTSTAVRDLRRQITAITDRSWMGRGLDAENVRTRRDLEIALAWSAFVKGEGFAIRVRRGARSAWRLVDAVRVKNPDGKPNDERLRDGFVLDSAGAVVGIWVVRSKIGKWGMPEDERPIFVPWYAEDGTPNVIHRVGYRLPGMLRGVSRLAPMVVMCRQLNGVLESHVAAKRLQAIFAMIVDAEDPETYRAAMENGTALGSPAMQIEGPLNVWVKPPGSTTQFTDTKFNGADLKDYLILCYKVLAACVQMPVDVVLCQMGEASLSSARAGLDQFDRTCQGEQDQHIAECTSVMDHVAISDAIVLGELLVPDESIPYAAKYSRPPKYSTDRLKDAQTIKALREVGVSGTTAFAMFGLSYEDEGELRAAEAEFDAAQQPSVPGQPATSANAPAQTVSPAPEDQNAAAPWWRRTLRAFLGDARRNAA